MCNIALLFLTILLKAISIDSLNFLLSLLKSMRCCSQQLWSPSRFGRAGTEHIQLFIRLRKDYNVYLYSVSTDNHTFNERAENEFSTQLLYAQKENFSRQDTVIPGLINALENGKFFGKTPKGYDNFGPRVSDPTKVQAFQQIKINSDGQYLKEAFKMKIYKSYTDSEIIKWLDSKGVKILKQTISNIWRNQFLY